MGSSSSAIADLKYDVFLSFRGADTRYNFTSHLYNALCKEGVNTFMDKELKRGEEISSTLFKVIERSKISIVVFSQNYAASKFCLDELVKILKCRTSTGQVVLPVFYKVDPLEVEKQTGSYGKALSRYEIEFRGSKRLKTFSDGEETIKEKMEKVQLWKAALAEAADLSGWDLHNRDEVDTIQEIVKCVLNELNHGHLNEGGEFVHNAPQFRGGVFPAKRMVGKEFLNNMELILQWLTSGEVSSIGIHGMGGVGKTTLLIHIRNKLADKTKELGHVYWVTASQVLNISILQNLIAKLIGLEFGVEDDLYIRAARISEALSSKGKFVLILDDLWNHFDLKNAGIPIENNGCKLIVTTRCLDVCTWMGLQKIKKLEPLCKEDAWHLFAVVLGHGLAANVEVIAKSIVSECDGLPLGIVTMAGSMRGVDDIHEWTNALTELRRSESRTEDMEDEVFQILRFSYARLNDLALQQCFLYCALFPEDYDINRENLITFLIAEGIIEQRMSRQMNFDKGHAMLNKLVKVSMLEEVKTEGSARYVKMHDLIRDMAIQIMKESYPSIIEAGRQLKHVSEEKYWTKGIVRVSLMSNDINEIPSNFSPMCPSLSTLLLSNNMVLKLVSDSFFLQFDGLKVLDLSNTGIEKLPESVGCLRNLKALVLRWCLNLQEMPSFVKLMSLEMLDLSFCKALKRAPEGLELLSHVKFLNLFGSGLTRLKSGMLTRLSHLQFLACNTHIEIKFAWLEMKFAVDLAQLQKVESLSWCFRSVVAYNRYVELVYGTQPGSQLISYFLSVGSDRKGKAAVYTDEPRSQEVEFHGCYVDSVLFIPRDVQVVRMKDVTVNGYISGFCFKTATKIKSFETELKFLSISDCEDIKYLFNLLSSPSIFENLEMLDLCFLPELLDLFHSEVMPMRVMPSLPSATSFSCLKQLAITNCKAMKKIFPSSLIFNLKNLEEIAVENCAEMEEIIPAAEVEASYHRGASKLKETIQFNLPKLRCFKLINLPKLKSICCAQIICDSFPEISIINCEQLQRIPISFSMESLQTHRLSVWPEKWWKSVEWGYPDQKRFLQPRFGRP